LPILLRTPGNCLHGLEFTAKFSNWVVNPPLDDKEFAVEIPPGSFVTDYDKNLSYRKGALNDPAIKGHIDKARKLAAIKASTPPRGQADSVTAEHFQSLARDNPYTGSRSGYRVAIGATAAVVIVAGLLLFRFVRRPRGTMTP